MKTFKLPSLPANCFGLALGTIVEDFDGKMETFDRRTLWFRGKNGKPGRGYRNTSVQKIEKNSTDTLSPVVSDAAPGSAERIEAMREFYADNVEVESAFEITDDEIANRLAHTFGKMLQNAEAGGNSIKQGKQELRREKRRIAE